MNTNLEDVINNIAENKYNFFTRLQNVNGVGFGFKTINGYVTNEPCIHVLVKKKLNESLIVNSQNIIPKTFMGIKTDVLEIGNPKPRSFTQKVRPLQGGYSIFPVDNLLASGTLGCVVTKLVDGVRKFFILSNNHVIAKNNKLPLGTPILQPSRLDGGSDTDVVAFLSEFIPLVSSPSMPYPINYVDAAIAEITDRSIISTIIASSGKIHGVVKPTANTFVKKSGRTTGFTKGTVTTVNTTLNFGNVIFKRQIIANLKNWYGDSGSVLLNKDNNAIGLLHDGENDNITIACPMLLVLKALNVKLLV